jgi:TolB-like protein/Tfp pilus assembly protein PilF
MPWDMKTEGVEQDTRRVAVLPLKNMSPDPNDEYFADGMTEELITSLSSVTELTVIARTSVMQYKIAPKRVADVGRELNVGTVVEGSVRKAGTKVRITVQLIDARNEGHLWAQNYDKQLDDVFTVQSEVAEKVAEALKVKLLKSDVERLGRGASTDPEAHNEYLKGMFYWNKRTSEGLKKAQEFFRKTVERDPSSPLGYIGLALAYFIMASNYHEDPHVYFSKAKEFASKALSIDERIPEPHAVLGAIASSYDRDWDRAEAEFKRAIDLNPSYPSAHQWYAQYLGILNRVQDAWVEVNRALELSPLSLIINTNVADGYFWMGQFEKGMEHARKVIDMDPGFPPAYATLAYNCCKAGKFEEAEKAIETYVKLTPPEDGKTMEAYLAAKEGKIDLARRLLAELSDPSQRGNVSLYLVGSSYVMLGDYDRGFELIEKAIDARDRYATYIGIDYDMDGVRKDPRYLRLLERLGLAGRLAP